MAELMPTAGRLREKGKRSEESAAAVEGGSTMEKAIADFFLALQKLIYGSSRGSAT